MVLATQVVQEFLGSAHVFSSAVSDVVEKKLLNDVAGKRLTFSQLKLLRLVAATEGHSIGDVAAFLAVSNAAASKAVDKLVRRRLLRRSEGKHDRRAIQLSLAEAGRRLLAAYEQARDRKLAEIFRAFPVPELRRATELLDRLSAGIVDHENNSDEYCFRCGIYFREKCLVRQFVKRNCFYVEHRNRKRGAAAAGAGGGRRAVAGRAG